MKIIHIIVGLEVGGAELMLSRTIHEMMAAKGDEFRVISLTNIGPIGERLRERGVAVEAFGMRSLLDMPWVLWGLSRRLRVLKPDVVQTWMYHADFLGGLAARLAGIHEVVWRIGTTDVSKGRSKLTVLLRWLCAKLSHSIPHTVLCAANAAQLAHLAVGYCANKMMVLPNGFDMQHLRADPSEALALRTACGFGSDDVVIGILGRFNAVKDQRNFIRAAGILIQRHENARFLIVGRGCDHKNRELANWIAETGAADRFVLLGQRNDAPICLAAMDIFVLSSKTEGFPNVLGEAMAMGRPCVTTDVGDAAYLLDGLGEVVPPSDSHALAEAISKVMRLSPQEVADLGVQARARIQSEFSMVRCAQRFAAVYADVLANPRR